MEFNGIGGGYQGEGSKTVIPSEAFAKITCRLVPNQKSEDISMKVKDAIQLACPSSVRVEVEVKGGGDPYVVIPPGKPGSLGNESALMKKAFSVAERLYCGIVIQVRAHFPKRRVGAYQLYKI